MVVNNAGPGAGFGAPRLTPEQPSSEVAAFVDFENIRYSTINSFGREPDPMAWRDKTLRYGLMAVARAYADFDQHPPAVRTRLDVAGFVFASGRVITVRKGWKGNADEQGFLREVAATGCARFTTFLGPGAPYHGDHFHVDLAHHGRSGTSRYCRPMPMVTPPERAPYVPQVVAGRMPVPVHTGSLTPDPFGVEKMQAPMSYAGQ